MIFLKYPYLYSTLHCPVSIDQSILPKILRFWRTSILVIPDHKYWFSEFRLRSLSILIIPCLADWANKPAVCCILYPESNEGEVHSWGSWWWSSGSSQKSGNGDVYHRCIYIYHYHFHDFYNILWWQLCSCCCWKPGSCCLVEGWEVTGFPMTDAEEEQN